ncbi:hypothetical protein EW145_g1809 [Phellinidium pouzarii]|uniref:Large ribosomal subunit protein uL23m n=1 Tax=Phellinidium pouzarii TaxID=167371 RepID=A0A4S4LDK3_9AGAM|nr:hypothetical protein EW145_g1809 [Phellinidium pouzarii]
MASSSIASLCLRRAHRTFATIASPSVASAAQAASAPEKVKERREQTANEFAKTPVDSRATTRTEKRRLVQPQIAHDSPRSRLRGVRAVKRADGSVGVQVVGQRIYLPNILFTLVRNHTLPGKAYNPYEATFHIPQNITKTDVRSYLRTLYGVDCTYIRTDNYLVPMKYEKSVRLGRREDDHTKRAYKRAVVGLKEPFYYPQMVEDMNGRERWLREAAIEDSFRLKEWKDIKKAMMEKQRGATENNVTVLKDMRTTRKTILRKLWERREEREKTIRDFAKQLDERRS